MTSPAYSGWHSALMAASWPLWVDSESRYSNTVAGDRSEHHY